MTQEPSIAEMVRKLQEDIRASALTPNIHAYKPHDKQEEFHRSQARGRLYIGGNRAGKTVGGATEAIWWLTHRHPYLRIPEGPIRGRCLSVDFTNGVSAVVKPEVKRWMAPSDLINGSWEDSYNNNERLLTLANGSFLEFKSYDQDLDKMAGTSRHFIWFDEEPPHSIYDENMMRLIDTNGKWWFTMTPVEGYTWTAEEIYEPAMRGEKNVDVIQVDTTENPYLDPEVIAEFMSNLTEDDRRARKEGKFVQMGGLIFTKFNPAVHVLTGVLPFKITDPNIRIMSSMDLGINNPTAWLWHAIRNDGTVITFEESFASGLTIPDWTREIKRKEEFMHRIPELRVGDPSIKQRSAQTGLSNQIAYSQLGIYIALANNDVLSGIAKMQDYLDFSDTKPPKWFIHESCANTIKEMRRYRWKTWETKKLTEKNNKKDEPHKKNDHCMDACRYFFSFLPDLTRKKEEKDMTLINSQIAATLGASKPVDMVYGKMDPNFQKQEFRRTEWTQMDDTLGGIW
jgi:phage terminase large subunit-like protein